MDAAMANRWGTDDERGAANLLTPEMVLGALKVPAAGRVLNLGSEIGKHGAVSGGRNKTWHVTVQVTNPADPGRGRAEDILTMHTHAHSHLDGLGHIWYDGRLYNDVPATVIGRGGAGKLGIDKIGGIVTRGLLIDVTQGGQRSWSVGELITADDLAAACRTKDVEPRPGDALLIRTGWFDLFLGGDPLFEEGEPGLDPGAVDWIVKADPVAIGVDNFAAEPVPAPVGSNPLLVHETLLRDRGIYMMELLDLRELALARASSFLLVVAPLLIKKGLGSPVNPIAVLLPPTKLIRAPNAADRKGEPAMGVDVDLTDEAAVVTLRWPERRNSLGPDDVLPVADAIQHASQAGRPVVILTGQGAFCAGGDLRGFAELSRTSSVSEIREVVYVRVQQMISALRDCRVPTIAAIDGPAVGLGMDLALACDMRFVGATGWMQQGWARVGLIPGAGGGALAWRLNPTIGWRLLVDQQRLHGPDCEGLGLAEAAEGTALAAACQRAHAIAQLDLEVIQAYVELLRPLGWPSDGHLAQCANYQSAFIGSERFRAMASAILSTG